MTYNEYLKVNCFPFARLQSYEARIDALQKQVEEQSMTMSMYSTYTTEDMPEEDVYCKYRILITLLKCSIA